MLSGLLINEIVVQVSINIMNAFVEMRKFILFLMNVLQFITIFSHVLEVLFIISSSSPKQKATSFEFFIKLPLNTTFLAP